MCPHERCSLLAARCCTFPFENRAGSWRKYVWLAFNLHPINFAWFIAFFRSIFAAHQFSLGRTNERTHMWFMHIYKHCINPTSIKCILIKCFMVYGTASYGILNDSITYDVQWNAQNVYIYTYQRTSNKLGWQHQPHYILLLTCLEHKCGAWKCTLSIHTHTHCSLLLNKMNMKRVFI